MKIGVIVPSFPTISETFILNHITGLLDSGHQVVIYSLKKNPEEKKHDIINNYKLLEQTKYLRKTPLNKMTRRFSTLFLVMSYSFRFPVKLYKALQSLLFQDREDFYLKLYFLFLTANRKIDVYHFHFGHVGRLGAFLKSVGFQEKMVTSFHGYDINQVPLQKGKDYYDELFKTGDHFIANSNFTKKQMTDLGCSENKISVIPVGLHIKDYPYKERKYPAAGPIQILTIGRLVEKKGHEYSIRAIARLIKEGFNIHYTIAGNGILRSKLKDLVAKLNIVENITFTGEITQQEAVHLYDKSHLFVLSSMTASNGDKEGQGLVLQEAQACGLPVVSTLHNGIPDGVLDGQSGFLVPEKDIEALSDAIRKLILHPSSWAQIGKAGRNFVERKYQMTVLIPQLLHLYGQVKK